MYYLTPNADRSGYWMLTTITIEGSGYVLRTVLLLTCAAVYCDTLLSPVIAKTHVLSDPQRCSQRGLDATLYDR
jgi:hypothetical protein